MGKNVQKGYKRNCIIGFTETSRTEIRVQNKRHPDEDNEI